MVFLPSWRPVALGIAIAFPCVQALAGPDYRIENRTEFLNYSISGPGKAQSFYDANAHLFHESDIQLSNFRWGEWDGMFNTTLRATNSRQYDPNDLSVQKLELHLKDPKNKLDFGDIFANLSPYSMMKGIKGASLQHNLNDDRNYFRVVYGSFDSQWAYLLKSNRTDEPMDRYGGGLRYQRSDDKMTLGFNMAEVADRADDPKRGTAVAWRQFLPAIDWEYRAPGMLWSGEHAYAATTSAAVGSIQQELSGSANRVSLRGAFRTVNLNASMERVTPNFVTLGGGSTPDRFRLYTRADWRIDRDWRLFGSYDYFFNSLDHQLTTRTSNEIMEVGATRSRLFDRRSASLSVSARSRYLWTENNTATSHSDRLHLKYRDRFLQDALDFGADWEKLLNRDVRITSTTTTNDHLSNNLYNLSFGYRGTYDKDWTIRTNLDLGKSEVQNRTTGGFDVNNTVRVSMSMSHPNTIEWGLSYDLGDNNATIVGNTSHQNRAMLYWSRRPQVLGGGSIRAEASLNDYRFDDTTRNYREQLLRMVVNWNLEKKSAQ